MRWCRCRRRGGGVRGVVVVMPELLVLRDGWIIAPCATPRVALKLCWGGLADVASQHHAISGRARGSAEPCFSAVSRRGGLTRGPCPGAFRRPCGPWLGAGGAFGLPRPLARPAVRLVRRQSPRRAEATSAKRKAKRKQVANELLYNLNTTNDRSGPSVLSCWVFSLMLYNPHSRYLRAHYSRFWRE